SISALAAFEGRGADASFPGLSNAARHFEQSRTDLKDALADYYDAIDDLVIEAKEILAGAYDDSDGESDGPPETPEALKDMGYGAMTLDDEIRLRTLLTSRVAEYERLLESDPDLIRDEFGVDAAAVKKVTGKDCAVEAIAPAEPV
ncbi:MAG: hypothetical protein AAFQ67_06990, partial [Pseudomonadota bacterium]